MRRVRARGCRSAAISSSADTDTSRDEGTCRAISELTRSPVPTVLRHAPDVLIGIAAVVLCVSAGVSAGTQGFEAGTVLRIAGVLGVLLVVLWLRRFESFLRAGLVLRPVLDIARGGGAPPVLSAGVAALVVL